MRILDLFAGEAGFSIAADSVWENAEHEFVEIDPFCQSGLRRLYPGSKIHGDIKTYRGGSGHPVDIVTGGFPCQPFSSAGKRRGTEDDRHLWPEMLRVIREVRPRWVIGENVGGILTWSRGMVVEQVLSDLESAGYETQPFIVPAAGVGAPHKRDRVWFVANTAGARHGGKSGDVSRAEYGPEQHESRVGRVADTVPPHSAGQRRRKGRAESEGLVRSAAARITDRISTDTDSDSEGLSQRIESGESPDESSTRTEPDNRTVRSDSGAAADSHGGEVRLESESRAERKGSPIDRGSGVAHTDPEHPGLQRGSSERQRLGGLHRREGSDKGSEWEKDWIALATVLCRVDDGLPAGLDKRERAAIYKAVKYLGRKEVERTLGIDLGKVDPWREPRIKVLGNAIVPQVAAEIMRGIKAVDPLMI